ncbi:hypothetical protein MGN01_33950 [Methylobacterium gnaphalii]|uniref:Uncharacterized protein n=1 Tax=Methylobacterium gnaphalii TaxID=1010610 RepID=A0A512JNL3_9HYPH|nr:hypothetical protein MGN01_33950 [Methylobacterium gnaphalii]GLS48797.1 hypothetical protein GCM10007885_16420 [Methylobacterium gnaphalii]
MSDTGGASSSSLSLAARAKLAGEADERSHKAEEAGVEIARFDLGAYFLRGHETKHGLSFR